MTPHESDKVSLMLEDRLERGLWIALLMLVPVSSSPLLPLGSGTLIRPLAFVPAVMLLGIAAARLLSGQWPKFNPDRGCFGLLFIFTSYVIISGLVLVAFLPDSPFKGQTPLDSMLRGLATLAVGIIFYAIARHKIRSVDDALLAEKYLMIGLGISVALAVFQVVAVAAGGQLLQTAQSITDVIAVRTAGLTSRGQGMGSEPSALAYQITLLIIPFLVARSVSRQEFVATPVHRKVALRTLMGSFLVLVGLLFAGSRFGIGSAIIIAVFSTVRAVLRGRVFAAVALMGVLALGAAGTILLRDQQLGAGSGYVVRVVPDLVELSLPDLADVDQTAAISDLLSISGRVVNGQAAVSMWVDYPIFGVSLGNGYRYFGKYVPDWAIDTILFAPQSEGGFWLDPYAPEKGNAKILPLRLLAETGLIGTMLFLLFAFNNIFCRDYGDRYFGALRFAAGAALCLSWLNSDTFADPAMWILLAFCHAAGHVQEKSFEPRRSLVTQPI